MTPNEYLDFTEPQEVIDRHIARYVRAIEYVDETLQLHKGIWYDAGCGSGYGTSRMRGAWNIGCDQNEEAIECARIGETGNVLYSHLGMWDIESIFKPGVIRAILCIHSFEHLDDQEQPHALCAFWRLLEPGGVLWMCCPVDTIRKDGYPESDRHHTNANPYHLSIPTTQEIVSGLKMAGFIADGQVTVVGHREYDATSGERETEVEIVARKL